MNQGTDPRRLTCFLSGRVQGVGMRYTVHELLRNSSVTGYVRNLDDGRVELVMEGELKTMDELLEQLQTIAPGNLHRIDRYESTATGEFSEFAIRRGG